MKILGLETNSQQTGFAIEMPNGHLGVMPCGEFDMQIFRGQRKDYPLIPHFQRQDLVSNSAKHCIAYIKRETFKEYLKHTAYCDNLGLDSYDLNSIAQHYGFATDYLDITMDKEVALFFAYTYYDEKDDSYKMIDFENDDTPTLYYTITLSFYNEPHLLVPINFQSVFRPQIQKALTFDATNTDANTYFTKCPLPKDQEAQKNAKTIYDKFKGGEVLFPQNEQINNIEQSIKKNKELDEMLFLNYCNEFKKDSDSLKKQLEIKGYKIQRTNFGINKELLAKIKNEVKKKITSSNVTTRLVYMSPN